MGCDIHSHLEAKVGDTWHTYTQPAFTRHYKFFGELAGVRGEGPAIVAPRGFPADAGLICQIHYDEEGTDAHTPGWVNMLELAVVQQRMEQKWPSSNWKTSWDKYIHTARFYIFGNDPCYYDGEEFDSLRLVFWFDN